MTIQKIAELEMNKECVQPIRGWVLHQDNILACSATLLVRQSLLQKYILLMEYPLHFPSLALCLLSISNYKNVPEKDILGFCWRSSSMSQVLKAK
jgi:hypothetical protein